MTNSELTPPGGDPAAVRVGDAERNAAVTALGEHMATGRLDLDEYGTRSAQANTARTVGDLQALFADLPAPHLALPGTAVVPVTARPAFVAAQAATGSAVATSDDRSRAQKFVAAASAGSAIIALVLFFATGMWWWFLLIPLISTVAGSVWGDSWKHPNNRD